MRLKHVKDADQKVEISPCVIRNPKSYKGNFQTLFSNDSPIHVEIGMGKGKFITDKAIQNPSINYIGIEKYDSVIVRAIEKQEALELENLKLIRMDAVSIDEIFSKEIDTIYLNFSDPWPKDRHYKRRLSSEPFLKKYDTIFKNTGHIIMKTDNRHLFEYSLASFTDYGYHIKDISLHLHQDLYEDNITTEYEEKFHSKGFPIYMVEVIQED